MAKSKTIRVTPNVLKCARVLREAIKALPAGDNKKWAQNALDYLDLTFSGEPQPNRGVSCPVNKLIIMQP
jgi:hypothetical protein